MTWLSKLKPKRGSIHSSKRLGRGRGSGKGGTAAKGHKGQKARSGGSIRRGFEGGQTPLYRRMPKVGFSNKPFATEIEIVNLKDLAKLTGEVTTEVLIKQGIVKSGPVKVIGLFDLKNGLTLKVSKVSAGAKQCIEKAGGKVEVVQ